MIRFLRVAYSIPHFPFLCNSISKLSLPLIPTFWGKKRRGTLERVPRTPQNFHKCALTRVLPVIFKWLRPEGMSVPRDFCSRGARGRQPRPSRRRPGSAPGMQGAEPPGKPAPRGLSRRGAGGASPRQNKTKILPLPHGGRGSGGWGQKSKLKAGAVGDQPDTPPPDTETAGTVSAMGDLMPGMQGAEPLA